MLHLVRSDDEYPAMAAHQREVDAIQAAIRAEGRIARPPLFKPAPARPTPSRDVLDHRIAEELEAIARRLEMLGGVLASEPILIQRHAGQLQSIDLIKQTLCHLSQVVATQEREKAVALITLSELKSRLERRPLSGIAG
jgi:hypothetical protein